MKVILVTYLKARPLALCIIQIMTTIPITNMYIFHCIYVHLQPKCKYITIENKHFQPMNMNFELKNNTSTEINEGQAEIQLPLVWKMQKNLFQAMGQASTNEIGKTRLAASEN